MKSRGVVPVLSALALVGLLSVVRAQQLDDQPRGPAARRPVHARPRSGDGEGSAFTVSGTTASTRTRARISPTCSRGRCDLEVEGQPPRTLKAGDVFMIPAGKVLGATTRAPAGHGDRTLRCVARAHALIKSRARDSASSASISAWFTSA